MKNQLLMGIRRFMFGIPRPLWQTQIANNAKRTRARLGFMTAEHHAVRDFAVRELPRVGKPLSPEFIASQLKLPVTRVQAILDELERNMTFLFRNADGAVAWAYPVTVDQTPHRVTFSTGEQLYSAWAIDAMAVPFVQGQLCGTSLSVSVETECGHCHTPLHLEIDSELNFRIGEEQAKPLVFVPLVDFGKLNDPSIIDEF